MSHTLDSINLAREQCTTFQYISPPKTKKTVVLGTVDLGCVKKKLGITK